MKTDDIEKKLDSLEQRVGELEKRLYELDKRTTGSIVIGPSPKIDLLRSKMQKGDL